MQHGVAMMMMMHQRCNTVHDDAGRCSTMMMMHTDATRCMIAQHGAVCAARCSMCSMVQKDGPHFFFLALSVAPSSFSSSNRQPALDAKGELSEHFLISLHGCNFDFRRFGLLVRKIRGQFQNGRGIMSRFTGCLASSYAREQDPPGLIANHGSTIS